MDLQQIDDLCDEFEAALRNGEVAQIEYYLERIDEQQRPKLLRELLEIEIELAGSNGNLIELQTSLKTRFPEQAGVVEDVVRRIARFRQIGDYEILEELGHGGMGIVYKARQKLLNQTVAIKVLSQTLLNDPHAVGRFRREMQLIGSLNHPGIVRALNAGEIDGANYLVMEFVDGITLQHLGDNLRAEHESEERSKSNVTTPFYPASNLPGSSSKVSFSSVQTPPVPPVFPVGAACEAIRQAALGLQHAHEFNLVHRDIKPANLMLDRRGFVKILDLGLGKFLDEQRSPDEHSSLTVAGTTIGTIDYISPEQCESAGEVDIRADLYSLGCSLFFLLTGHPPYFGSRYDTTRKKMMGHIVGEIPKLQKIVLGIPEELEAILQKVLAKEPNDRYQTPLEFAEALAPFSMGDELINLIGGEMPSSIRHLPGSTGSFYAGSQLPSIAHKTKKLRFIGALVFVHLFLFFGVLGGAFLLIQYRQKPAPPVVAPNTAPVAAQPPVQTAPVQNQNVVIQSDLALLPGLNGAWWFDEIPWYLPCIRELLIRKIEETDDIKNVLSDDPEKYYDPNVAVAEGFLWELYTKYRNELSPENQILVEKLKQMNDSDTEVEWKIEEFNSQFSILNSQLLHTQALLEHRVAAVRNDRELAAVAAKHYEQALELYRKEAIEKPYLRKLEFLCMSDAARVEYLATGDYSKAIKKFETVMQQRKTNERLGALFAAEFRADEGTTAAAAGLYDDMLFARAKESFLRERERNKIHPLTAYIAEQHAWSLLDQWKVAEAEKQFTEAVIIRAANNRETDSRWALINALHDRHGHALTARYRGNTERAVEEYRTALKRIDEELAKCTESQSHTSADQKPSGLDRVSQKFKERAANTRERLADCTLYGGAASGTGQSRLTEMTKLYEEASQLYKAPSMVRTMRCKQAIGLLLQGKTEEAEQVFRKLRMENEEWRIGDAGTNSTGNNSKPVGGMGQTEKKEFEFSNLQFASQPLRTELVKQLAEAMLLFQKNANNLEDRKKLLRQFLHQFTIPSNPAGADALRRETLELRLFCAEFLVNDAWNKKDIPALQRDLPFLRQPINFFFERPGSKPFIRRYCDLIVRTLALLYDHASDPGTKQGQIVGIVQILENLRLQETNEKKESAGASPTLVVFFLTEEPKDGFVIFYPQDDRPGKLFRLPITRRQIKEGAKPDEVWTLDPQLLKLIEDERNAQRLVRVSWQDTAAWSKAEDALTDAELPFILNTVPDTKQ